jgi:ABC-type transport system involved in multi-copper enzyme maturation permease subunit
MARNDSSPAGPMPAGRSIPQIIALTVGVVYILIGLIGFLVTGFDGNFAGHTDQTLLGFEINPLHNLVHLAVGVIGVALSRTLSTARTFGWLLFLAFGALFLYGLFAVNRTDGTNFLSLNIPDNGLHLLTSLVGLTAALWPVRAQVRQAQRQMQAARRG